MNSLRLPGWDYSASGVYFVTVSTWNGERFFGEVRDGTVRLSSVGEIVAAEWLETAVIRPALRLDDWIVMPNHLHGIIAIPGSQRSRPASLGEIIGCFKGACTRRIHAAGHPRFRWHRGYHDRVIRSEQHLLRARRYIHRNPLPGQ